MNTKLDMVFIKISVSQFHVSRNTLVWTGEIIQLNDLKKIYFKVDSAWKTLGWLFISNKNN